MDNSLQEIAGSFTFAGMKRITFFAAALLPALMLAPMSAQASGTTSCDAGICQTTFNYTGATQYFEIPEGITQIQFDVQGASGGRGGAGGRVTGTLSNLPQILVIEIGGAGAFGTVVAGGYNGGGAAGGSRANEGAGGGASDIRLATELESRIVIAGGGGGAGGYSGGAGGQGGGLAGGAGGDGQGTGGKGGTDLEGGSAGQNNGPGLEPTAGALGIGGAGGFGQIAGGGGGGGGYFGGGGGGGDNDDTGFDGGGGGGGSSFADAELTSNVSHQSGFRFGNGRIILTYQFPLIIESFTGFRNAANEITFDVLANTYISDFTSDDLEFVGPSCQIFRITVNLMTANIKLRNCPHGSIQLVLKADSIGSSLRGPATPVSVTVFNDKQGPEFQFLDESLITSQSEVIVHYQISDDLVLTTADLFQINGCQKEIVETGLRLFGCVEGQHTLSFAQNSLSDSWGNLGPAQSQVWVLTIDQTGPSVEFLEVQISGQGDFVYQTSLSYSEPIYFDQAAVLFESDQDCQATSAETSFSASCGYAVGSWSLDTGQVYDALGNPGSQGVISANFSNPAPVIEPELPIEIEAEPEPQTEVEPTQEPTQQPILAEPRPQPAPEPEVPESPEPTPEPAVEPVTESELLPVEVVESVDSAEPIQPKILVLTQSASVPNATATEPVELEIETGGENIQIEPVAPALSSDPPLTVELALGPEPQSQEPQTLDWLWWSLGASVLVGLGAGLFGYRKMMVR